MSVKDGSRRYPMPKGNRGFALIFVNDEFQENTEQDSRRGADIDLNHLVECSTKLGFNPLPIKNQSTSETVKILHKFATGRKRKEDHAVVVAFSTHGTQYSKDKGTLASDVVYCTDGILEVSTITGLLCQSEHLKDKPKLFFFQACRGLNYDTTLTKTGEDVEKVTMDLSGMNLDITSTSTVQVPLQKDVFLAFSSPPGYLSLRSVTRGSFFVTALHDVIMEHGHDLDLLNLMVLVNNRSLDSEFMVKRGQGQLWETNRKCIPWMASMLLKEVWFA